MKILTAVMGCHLHEQLGFHQAIRDTWGKQINEFTDFRIFVGRQTHLHIGDNVIQLDVPDTKDHLLEKVVAICKFAVEEGYDSIFKVNTNTYINVPLLRTTEHWKYDYAGAVVGTLGSEYAGTEALGFVQGSASWLSRNAMKLVEYNALSFMIEHLQPWLKYNHLIAPYPHSEDLWIGQVLGRHYLNTMTDQRYSNGPISFWSQSNYIKTQRLVKWMTALHNAKSDDERVELNRRYRAAEL